MQPAQHLGLWTKRINCTIHVHGSQQWQQPGLPTFVAPNWMRALPLTSVAAIWRMTDSMLYALVQPCTSHTSFKSEGTNDSPVQWLSAEWWPQWCPTLHTTQVRSEGANHFDLVSRSTKYLFCEHAVICLTLWQDVQRHHPMQFQRFYNNNFFKPQHL